MNLDPAISLALALHAHKGAYALLLGSGISMTCPPKTGPDGMRVSTGPRAKETLDEAQATHTGADREEAARS